MGCADCEVLLILHSKPCVGKRHACRSHRSHSLSELAIFVSRRRSRSATSSGSTALESLPLLHQVPSPEQSSVNLKDSNTAQNNSSQAGVSSSRQHEPCASPDGALVAYADDVSAPAGTSLPATVGTTHVLVTIALLVGARCCSLASSSWMAAFRICMQVQTQGLIITLLLLAPVAEHGILHQRDSASQLAPNVYLTLQRHTTAGSFALCLSSLLHRRKFQ